MLQFKDLDITIINVEYPTSTKARVTFTVRHKKDRLRSFVPVYASVPAKSLFTAPGDSARAAVEDTALRVMKDRINFQLKILNHNLKKSLAELDNLRSSREKIARKLPLLELQLRSSLAYTDLRVRKHEDLPDYLSVSVPRVFSTFFYCGEVNSRENAQVYRQLVVTRFREYLHRHVLYLRMQDKELLKQEAFVESLIDGYEFEQATLLKRIGAPLLRCFKESV